MIDEEVNKEDARFILPYCFHSNLIMGLDARELEKMVVSFLYGNLSKIQELKELGEILFEIIKEKIPYLTETIEKANKEQENPFKYLEGNTKRPEIKILEKPVLLAHTPDVDDTIIKSNKMYH